jgi:hypothetical protein
MYEYLPVIDTLGKVFQILKYHFNITGDLVAGAKQGSRAGSGRWAGWIDVHALTYNIVAATTYGTNIPNDNLSAHSMKNGTNIALMKW